MASSTGLVPAAHLFTLKNPTEENMEGGASEEEDDFQTDDDEDMEVETPALQKRKKVSVRFNDVDIDGPMVSAGGMNCHDYVFQVQGGGAQKKFRNNRWKSGRKKRGSVK